MGTQRAPGNADQLPDARHNSPREATAPRFALLSLPPLSPLLGRPGPSQPGRLLFSECRVPSAEWQDGRRMRRPYDGLPPCRLTQDSRLRTQDSSRHSALRALTLLIRRGMMATVAVRRLGPTASGRRDVEP